MGIKLINATGGGGGGGSYSHPTTGTLSATVPVSVTANREVHGGATTISIDTANIPVYTGATSDLILGSYKLSAGAITCGTLQGIVMSTGGSFADIATGGTGQFLYHAGGNTYAYADTSATGGLGTDTVVPYVGAISALVLGQNLSVSAITCGTLQGVITGTGGTFQAITTGGTGQFFYHAGNNTYAYADTQASLPSISTGILGVGAGLNTDNTRYVLGGAVSISVTTMSGLHSKSFCIVAPEVSTYGVWRVPYDITLSSVNCLLRAGSSTNITGALYEGDGDGASLVTSTINAAIAGGANTASNIVNSGIDAGDYLVWVNTATSTGAKNQLTVTMDYTI